MEQRGGKYLDLWPHHQRAPPALSSSAQFQHQCRNNLVCFSHSFFFFFFFKDLQLKLFLNNKDKKLGENQGHTLSQSLKRRIPEWQAPSRVLSAMTQKVTLTRKGSRDRTWNWIAEFWGIKQKGRSWKPWTLQSFSKVAPPSKKKKLKKRNWERAEKGSPEWASRPPVYASAALCPHIYMFMCQC